MQEPQVIIVGAGAAGVGAALELQEHSVTSLVLEAADRVGGRAYTDTTSLPVPWDQGCHWLHCADVNPLVEWADKLGSIYERQDRVDHFAIWQAGRFASPEECTSARNSVLNAYGAIDNASEQGKDVPITEILPDAGRWNPGVRSILQAMGGDDPELISADAYADYEDTDLNWPVLSGYGDLIARMAKQVQVKLGTCVRRIEQGPGSVRVDTNHGKLKTSAVIVTVSTNVLSSGAINFGNGPARELVEQMDSIPCGAYEKVAFAIKNLPSEILGKQFCTIEPSGKPAVEFQIMPGKVPLIIAHIAGDIARNFEGAPASEISKFAEDHLVMAFGEDFRKDMISSGTTNWSANPLILGSYSHATPGNANLRREMIKADTGNVAFAGEAFSLKWQATAHGAYLSGRDVARGIVKKVLT